MELDFIVRDQEVGGSNPLAPTTPLESATYFTRKSEERLVQGQALDGSNPFVPITLFSLKSLRYAAFSAAPSTSFVRTIRTTSQHPWFSLDVRSIVAGESLMPNTRQLSSQHPFVRRARSVMIGRPVYLW